MSKGLAAVFAHPDDDTYGVGGSAALHSDDGTVVTVVLATSGEAGPILDESLAKRENLGQVREEEDRASWGELAVTVSHHFLRYPDAGLADVPREELASRIADVLTSARPDVVVTFGPDGVTGHPDHVAVGAAATEAFHDARRVPGDGFHRLLYVGIAATKLDRFAELLRARGIDPPDPAQPFSPRGVADETIAVSVDCTSVYERKLEALRRHKTQGEMQDVPYDLWPLMLGTEEFVQAWPEREPGPSVRSDVFEGLPDP